jgi:hypothetical protein
MNKILFFEPGFVRLFNFLLPVNTFMGNVAQSGFCKAIGTLTVIISSYFLLSCPKADIFKSTLF